MSEITIGKRPVDEMADAEILTWMRNLTGGYRLRDKTAALWLAVFRVLDRQGPPMTIRGLFYGLEMLGLVPKSEAGYKQVAYQVLQMRRQEVLPYGFVTDGTRWVRKPETYSGLNAFMARGQEAYRRALWDNQAVYVELWCEKDAIAGILHGVTDPWDVPLYVCRGFASDTYLYRASETIKAAGKPTLIYYVGDLDPSGWSISETIERRLREFGADFTFERLTVQPWQVGEWDLPTRPMKPKDTRGKDWRFPCVEVDAVPADRLRKLCEDAITRHIDQKAYQDVLKAEELERESLRAVAVNMGVAA